MNKFLLSLTLILSSCSAAESSQAIEISNFKSGLVCHQQSPNNKNKSDGQICFETDTVNVTGQGTCIYNGNRESCTWYGYEFDYKNASSNQVINCKATSSDIASYGNPEGVIKEDAHTFEYDLPLKSNEGHFYNPQYSGFSYATDDNQIKTEETICSVDNEELFRFKFKLIYPVIAK